MPGHTAADPSAEVIVDFEIHANFTEGANNQTKRAVVEIDHTLGFRDSAWE